MAADTADLARELRDLANPWNGAFALTLVEGARICDAMRRAADALESRLAAEREALATWLSEHGPEIGFGNGQTLADRLLASVIVAVPTREMLAPWFYAAGATVQTFDGDGNPVPWQSAVEVAREQAYGLADGVLALMGTTALGSVLGEIDAR